MTAYLQKRDTFIRQEFKPVFFEKCDSYRDENVTISNLYLTTRIGEKISKRDNVTNDKQI